ncbi:MAG: L,D-transpeptidase [Thermodesulfobacteriota bacterium]
MRSVVTDGTRSFVVLLSFLVVLGSWGDVCARNTDAGPNLVSMVRPADIPDRSDSKLGPIDQILGAEITEPNNKGLFLGRIPHSPWTPGRSEFPWKAQAMRAGRSGETLIPGALQQKMHGLLTRGGSGVSVGLSEGKQRASLVDSIRVMDFTGRLSVSPGGVYSHLEIHVHRSKFLVYLYGITYSGERKELFWCKAGLGSPEYPTPVGSYYILRIYDKHPLWIPPQDREWAYGMTPSHSVYGGHMMPFFSKIQERGRARDFADDQGLDRIAPEMKMVDAGAYRIHGTDQPWTMGQRQSHGCVRLRNESVKVLADLLKLYVGTKERGTAPNGEYVDLRRPVRLTLF